MLAFFNAAGSLEELATPPNYGLRQLNGDRKGIWSMTVTKNWRPTFSVNEEGALTDMELVETGNNGCLKIIGVKKVLVEVKPENFTEHVRLSQLTMAISLPERVDSLLFSIGDEPPSNWALRLRSVVPESWAILPIFVVIIPKIQVSQFQLTCS